MTGPVNGNLSGSFASLLREAMFERRMSVGQLARTTGIDIRLLRKYRAGSSVPRDYFGFPTPNAEKIAAALGVGLDELLPPERTAA